ncbi:MAG TPA: serine hydrolase [Gemmatimonas sp.]|uniref:serine hydrolase domain-containing protein n=1 Tax=Gemmatimonas sp. TaxID=1962908 RepID=UPI002EDB4845
MQLLTGIVAFSGLLITATASAQGTGSALADSLQLAGYEGQYQYRDGDTLTIVADRGRVVAVLDEAKYPLRAVAVDTFMNGSGDRIPFLRDATGRVTAFRERGDTFTRLSATVPREVRGLLQARTVPVDGSLPRYRCAAPANAADGLRVATPGRATLPCEVAARLVDGVIDGVYPDVRALLVYHKGVLVLDEYFYGYDRDRPHQMRSLTKSVVAMTTGAAVDRRMSALDDRMLDRLGYQTTANPDPRKARITLQDLLTNQSGLACDDHDGASPGNETKLYESADWPRAFVDLPMIAEPGTVGRYCSFGILTAGRMVERATGKHLPRLANEVLFTPLGIKPTQWRWTFELDRSQRNDFGQVYLRPRDMLKLGVLVLQRGRWQGRQVLSETWIDAMTAKHSRVDDSDYGLAVWHRWYNVPKANGSQRVETIMFSGNGGQKVYIVPSLDLVVVFTGGAFNVESPVNTMMAGVLLPAFLPGP